MPCISACTRAVYQCLDRPPSGRLNIEFLTRWSFYGNTRNTTETKKCLPVRLFLTFCANTILSCFDFLQVFASFNFHQGKPSVKKDCPKQFSPVPSVASMSTFLPNIFILINNTSTSEQYRAIFLARSRQVALWLAAYEPQSFFDRMSRDSLRWRHAGVVLTDNSEKSSK